MAAYPACGEYEMRGRVWHCLAVEMQVAMRLALREWEKYMKPVKTVGVG